MGKKTAIVEVQRERRVVETTVMARRGQRRSGMQVEEMLGRKVKDLGKGASNGMLLMPFRVVEGKFVWVPVRVTTPQPPWELEMMPAWMAAWQRKESAR